MQVVSQTLEFVGYIPIVGTILGVCRIITGGIISKVAHHALKRAHQKEQYKRMEKLNKVIHFAHLGIINGMIELIPLLKLIIKIKSLNTEGMLPGRPLSVI